MVGYSRTYRKREPACELRQDLGGHTINRHTRILTKRPREPKAMAEAIVSSPDGMMLTGAGCMQT
jgi:hypothetical protein